jgi:uncharacterized SAM-binding protein YcdF (DUF218 family)
MRAEYVIRVRPRAWLRIGAAALAAVSALALLAYAGRVTLLTAVGRFLVSVDPPAAADAIVVLAGGTPEREIGAADLFRAGFAPRVVLTREPEPGGRDALRRRGVAVPTIIEERQQMLARLGVPPAAQIVLPDTVESTWAEARAVHAWMGQSGARSLLVVTAPFHTARARFVFRREFRGDQRVLRMIAADPGSFGPGRWWQTRTSLRDGLFELEKTLYYRVRFCCG